jgi:haloalkane dehalogenase
MTTRPTIDPTDFSAAFEVPTARIDTGRGTLAYYRFGAGPDVVATHGWPLHSATFRTLLPYLTRDFTVHMFDLPGTGQSQWRDAASFETNAEALRLGIDAIGLSRYALLAHDSGGVVSRIHAASDPRVCGLVLSGSEIPGHHPTLLHAYVLAAKAGVASALLSALRIGVVRRSSLGFGACFADGAYADGEFGRWFVRPLANEAVARGQMELLRSFDFAKVDALAGVHARITAPTLCVWGDRDPYFPIAKARAMLPQFAGGATLVAIPGAKLFAHEDHPAAFAAHAGPFLARCLADDGLSTSARIDHDPANRIPGIGGQHLWTAR